VESPFPKNTEFNPIRQRQRAKRRDVVQRPILLPVEAGLVEWLDDRAVALKTSRAKLLRSVLRAYKACVEGAAKELGDDVKSAFPRSFFDGADFTVVNK
jgi:hypothetical protein